MNHQERVEDLLRRLVWLAERNYSDRMDVGEWYWDAAARTYRLEGDCEEFVPAGQILTADCNGTGWYMCEKCARYEPIPAADGPANTED